MPIIKKRGTNDDLTLVYMGNGDVQTVQAFYQDPQTGLVDLPRSVFGFVEMESPDGMVGGGEYSVSAEDFPNPDVTLHFGSLEVLDHYIKTLQSFRKGYVDRVTAITRNAAQA